MTTRRSTPADGESKKRRIPGACDHCKRKKIRCDSTEMPGNRCSNCVHFQLHCTHKQVTKALGPAKGYIESLESRLEKMESLLKKLSPGIDLNREMENLSQGMSPPSPDPTLFRNDDDAPLKVEGLEQLNLYPAGRFFGKSSGYQLIQTALDIRGEYIGEDRSYQASITNAQRPEFWSIPEWRLAELPPDFIFPDSDLLPPLLDAYFTQINQFLPLLHRPSFERSIADGVHLRDNSFGGTLLLVCALGAQYSEDPRVFIEGSNSLHSAGWKWFRQVSVINKPLSERPSVHDLQSHALSIIFIRSTETPQGCWIQLGMALRMAQEVGAHRLRPLKAPAAEGELWKRAFWVLLTLDRQLSSYAGRQCVLQDEDYDVELPVDCDDEFWDHPDPTLNFKQPSGKPSTMSFFHFYLRLHDILAAAMRALYSIRKPNSPVPRGADPRAIVELDSAMNSWMDSIPPHLRWNPKCEQELYSQQSATLYATYYYVQIFIHRPFIPSFRNPLSTTFPSLAICTNAARSCCHVMEVQSRKNLPIPITQPLIFTSVVVLLLHIWSSQRSGYAPYPRREIDGVQKCMDILKACERRWCTGGRYWDVLSALATAGNVPLASSGTESTSFNVDQRVPDAIVRPIQPNLPCDPSRPITEYRSFSPPPRDLSAPASQHSQPPNYALPMYSAELGRLPVYGQFNFSDSRANSSSASISADVDYPNAFVPQTPSIDVQDISATPLDVSITQFAMTDARPVPGSSFCRESLENLNTATTFTAQSSFDTEPIIDDDTMTMWSTAPAGFELDEWGTYITNFNQITYGQDFDNAYKVT